MKLKYPACDWKIMKEKPLSLEQGDEDEDDEEGGERDGGASDEFVADAVDENAVVVVEFCSVSAGAGDEWSYAEVKRLSSTEIVSVASGSLAAARAFTSRDGGDG